MDRIVEASDSSCEQLPGNRLRSVKLNNNNDSGYCVSQDECSCAEEPLQKQKHASRHIKRTGHSRSSFKDLRHRTEAFFRKRFRFKCLQPSCDRSALAMDEVDGMLPGGELSSASKLDRLVRIRSAPRMETDSMADVSSDGSMSNSRCHSIKSCHSNSNPDIDEKNEMIWMNNCSSTSPVVESPTSVFSQNNATPYSLVLSTVACPLGSSSKEPGQTTPELTTHLREVYNVDSQTHAEIMSNLRLYKASDIELVVTVIEAKDLKLSCGSDQSAAIAQLAIDSSSSSSSPRSTPGSSPHSSPPQIRRRKSRLSLDHQDSGSILSHTQSTKSSKDAQWNETFRIKVKDLQNDELQILFSNGNNHQQSTNSNSQSTISHSQSFKNPQSTSDNRLSLDNISLLDTSKLTPTQPRESRNSIKSVFRQLRHSLEICRNNADWLGELHVPLKEIPVTGCTRWYPVFRDKKQKNQQGQCRLKLQLISKLASVETADRTIDRLHPVSLYFDLVKRVYIYTIVNCTPKPIPLNNSDAEAGKPDIKSITLSQSSKGVLKLFRKQNGLTSKQKKVVELAVVLHIMTDKIYKPRIEDTVITDRLDKMIRACQTCERPDEHPSELTNHICINDHERGIIDQAIEEYLERMLISLKSNSAFPVLFPPSALNWESLNKTISSPTWKLIDTFNRVNNPQDLGHCVPLRRKYIEWISERLQTDVKSFLEGKCRKLEIPAGKEPVLEKTSAFVDILVEVQDSLSPKEEIAQFFGYIGVGYYRLASLASESILARVAQSLADEMNGYQMKYVKFKANIAESSVLSLKHFYALRTVYQTVLQTVSEKEIFRISLSGYQTWFSTSVTFWLQTFRDGCMKRMENALTLDKDMVQVTSMVKYSNSSVDVLSCFAQMTTEWQAIDLADADLALLGITKLTDTICDCIKQYTEKVIDILENNGYYDIYDNQQFDVTDQLCISLNNISHLRCYLNELPTLLKWEEVAQRFSSKHERPEYGEASIVALRSLVACTDDEMMFQGRSLSKQIIEKIAVDLRNFTVVLTRNPDKADVMPLFKYIETNCSVLFQQLEKSIQTLFLEEIWKTEITVFKETMAIGRPPEYYQKLQMHLESLKNHFYQFKERGIDPVKPASCKLYCHLCKTLELNSQPSKELMLRYYKSITEESTLNIQSFLRKRSLSDFGKLTTKVGYKIEADNSISVHVHVFKGENLPGITNKNLSNPYVRVNLCPSALTSKVFKYSTRPKCSTVNPVYDEKVIFNITEENFNTPGAVLIFSVWHYEVWLTDDFLGEAALQLSSLRQCPPNQEIDELPVNILQLRRPKEPKDGPYKVVKERSNNGDRTSQAFINERNSTVAFQVKCRLCRPVKSLMSSITGKKMEVIGKQGSLVIE